MFTKLDFTDFVEINDLLYSENTYKDCDILCCGKRNYTLQLTFNKKEKVTEIELDKANGEVYKILYIFKNPDDKSIEYIMEKFSYICDTFLIY